MGKYKNKKKQFISFLKETTRFGVNGIGRMLAVVTIFGLMGLVFFLLDLFAVIGNVSFWGWIIFLLSIAGGVASMVFAIYLTYKYLKFAVLNYVFVNTAWVIKSVCTSIVEEASQTATVQAITHNKQVSRIYLAGNQLKETYYNKVPAYMHRGLLFILAFIPFMDIFFGMKGVLSSKSKKEGGEMFFQQVSFYFSRSVVKKYSKYTVYFLFGLTLVFQILLYLLVKNM